MKRCILIVLTVATLLGINAFDSTNLHAQSLQETKTAVMGVKISKAYPNPASEFVNFDYVLPNEATKAEVQLFNVLGQIVLRKELQADKQSEKISVLDLKKGVYFYRLVVNRQKGPINKLILHQ